MWSWCFSFYFLSHLSASFRTVGKAARWAALSLFTSSGSRATGLILSVSYIPFLDEGVCLPDGVRSLAGVRGARTLGRACYHLLDSCLAAICLPFCLSWGGGGDPSARLISLSPGLRFAANRLTPAGSLLHLVSTRFIWGRVTLFPVWMLINARTVTPAGMFCFWGLSSADGAEKAPDIRQAHQQKWQISIDLTITATIERTVSIRTVPMLSTAVPDHPLGWCWPDSFRGC